MTEQLLRLPEKPGTVIAIGEWWLVRLRPCEGHPSAWEMLPLPSKELREHAQRNGASGQCIYGDDWVLAEAEQEGGYLVISDPRDEPSGIQYFKPSAKLARAKPEPLPNHCPECGAWGTVETHLRGCSRDPAREEKTTVNIPIGTRIYLRLVDTMRGTVEREREGGHVDVRWDHGGATTISQDYIGPEAALPSEAGR